MLFVDIIFNKKRLIMNSYTSNDSLLNDSFYQSPTWRPIQ